MVRPSVEFELVDNCGAYIRQLKLAKARGSDNLSAEHLLHAHPVFAMHLLCNCVHFLCLAVYLLCA